MKILNTKVDNIDLEQAVDKIDDWIAHSSSLKFVATPNPEILLEAKKNAQFKQILNRADLSIPDGTGIIWASKKYKNRLKRKVPGIDLIESLAKRGMAKGYRWFLLGGTLGVAKKAGNKLESKYPGNKIIKSSHGGNIDIENLDAKKNLVEKINKAKVDILVVCFGAPKQEKFIDHFKSSLGAKVAISAGGSLDFISGKRKRAPKLMRVLGIEWLWRLLLEPRRLKRIYNALIKFPIAVKRDIKTSK